MREKYEFDFTTVLARRGMDAVAYDSVGSGLWGIAPAAPKEGFDVIPMWVADMNFPTCPAIVRAITERAQHPAFGYFLPRDAYFAAIAAWRKPGHPDIPREAIGYENGVHGFVTSAVQALTEPGEAILLHSPYYVGFRADIEGLGRRSVFSELRLDEDGVWRMDYEDMDRKIRENGIRVVLFCAPHNPTGRVWTREELERAAAVFEKNDVTVISDEIWADLVFPGKTHIPLQSVNPWMRAHTAAAYAPSKTFNLAGLIGSYHVIYDKALRDRIVSWGKKTHYNEMNVLSMHALLGAYSEEGRRWTEELREVLERNAALVCRFFREEVPGVFCSMPEGTYMLFADCAGYMARTGRTLDDLLQAGWAVGVAWQDGRKFRGETHIRLNLASPESRIREALKRMKAYVFTE